MLRMELEVDPNDEDAKFNIEFVRDEIRRLERFRGILHLQELAETVRETSLCGLGQTAPNPVLSTLRFFRNEYEELLQPDKFGPRTDGEPKRAAATK